MATHAGQLGRHKPTIPEQELKRLTLMSDLPPIIKTHTKEKRKNKWQEEKQLA
jgi:hypothetical protein